jgi:hypothetical protein
LFLLFLLELLHPSYLGFQCQASSFNENQKPSWCRFRIWRIRKSFAMFSSDWREKLSRKPHFSVGLPFDTFLRLIPSGISGSHCWQACSNPGKGCITSTSRSLKYLLETILI